MNYALLIARIRNLLVDALVRLKRCQGCRQFFGLQRWRSTVHAPTDITAGSGLICTYCVRCGHYSETSYYLPQTDDPTTEPGTQDRKSRFW